MRPVLILISTILVLALNAIAHQDATALPMSGSFKMTFFSPATEPKRSIEVIYDRNETKSITVHFFDKPITIPTEELKDITKIQFDSITFHYGTFEGRRYCYIEALFGSDIGAVKPVFKRIRMTFEDRKYRDYKIFPSQSDYRTEATKPNGKPIKKANKDAVANPRRRLFPQLSHH